jgi:L-iditol 2-dehydrogenase
MNAMKAVKWVAPRTMRIEDVERPVPKPHEALIRIESTGVCGSDMHYYEDGHIGKTVITDPLVLGHEYAGVVEDVGAEADRGLIGKRVAVEPGIPCGRCEFCRAGHYNVCRDLTFPGGPPHDGALCEYLCVHAGFCFPVPDGMTAAQAAMVEPLAVAVHAVELAHVRPGDDAVVLGLGPIGLLTARVAKLSGVRRIYGVDLLEYRVKVSNRFGVDAAIDASKQDTVEAVMALTGGRGADIAFDCARSTETPGVACHVLRPAGRGVLVGISGESEGSFPVDIARRKELTLTWCRRFRFNFPTAIELIASGAVDVDALITHRFPLERSNDAYELVSRFDDNVLKVSVDQ